MSEIAAEIGQGLPMLVDEETELSRVTTSGSVLIYHFRFINTDREQVDPTELVSRIEPPIVEQLCSSPETRDEFLQRGVTLRYSYADRLGAELAAFDVTVEDCGFEELSE